MSAVAAVEHGTETAYRWHGCRCDACREHRAAAHRASYTPKPRAPREPAPIAHGTPRGYQRGCRCDECREARSEQAREYRTRRAARDGATPPKPRKAAAEPCERLHADAVLDLLERRARALELAVIKGHPGAQHRRVEVLQLLGELKRHGVTR